MKVINTLLLSAAGAMVIVALVPGPMMYVLCFLWGMITPQLTGLGDE